MQDNLPCQTNCNFKGVAKKVKKNEYFQKMQFRKIMSGNMVLVSLVHNSVLAKIGCPKSSLGLLCLFLPFGFITGSIFQKASALYITPLRWILSSGLTTLFSLSLGNPEFLVLILHALLCLLHHLLIPSSGFHLGTENHSHTVISTFSIAVF